MKSEPRPVFTFALRFLQVWALGLGFGDSASGFRVKGEEGMIYGSGRRVQGLRCGAPILHQMLKYDHQIFYSNRVRGRLEVSELEGVP